MGIVDFILDNLYLVIILLGFLVSVLGKGARNQEKQPTQGGTAPVPQQRAPSTAGGPVRRPPAPTTRQQPPGQTPRRPPQTIPQSAATGEAGQPQRRQLTMFEQQAERERIQVASQRAEENAVSRVNRPSRKVSIHANKAVEGMMWAEVFGPPRARRGHSSRYPRERR